jgi:hypothetical protein
MDIDFCVNKYLQNYNLLIEQLTFLFTEEDYKEYIIILNGESKDKKWLRGVRFQQQLSDELFDIFLDSKIKLFSHKDNNTKNLSESLFGSELSLKKIFNNRDDNTKFIVWSYLHLIVLMVELAQKTQNKERVKKLSKLINDNESLLEKTKTKISRQNNIKDPKKIIKDMFNVDVNDQTNDMLNDIVKSFESSLKGDNANPLNGILDISKKISSKYQDKINSGEIELNKLMEGIQQNIPGMNELMKGGMGDIGSMMGGMMNGGDQSKPKETVIIDENFTTANVELGEQKVNKEGFNIGKMLKIANSFGVLGGDNKSGDNKSGDNKDNTDNDMNPNNINIKELFGMMSMLGKSNNEEDVKNIKTKMDEFLSKQGIDINKLNEQIDTMMKQNKGISDDKETDTKETDTKETDAKETDDKETDDKETDTKETDDKKIDVKENN